MKKDKPKDHEIKCKPFVQILSQQGQSCKGFKKSIFDSPK